jgi:hypothetical protein
VNHDMTTLTGRVACREKSQPVLSRAQKPAPAKETVNRAIDMPQEIWGIFCLQMIHKRRYRYTGGRAKRPAAGRS